MVSKGSRKAEVSHRCRFELYCRDPAGRDQDVGRRAHGEGPEARGLEIG